MAPPTKGGQLRRAKETCLLAVLALSSGQVVSAETLISKVWDDDAPSQTVKNTLRSYMVHVKEAVAAVGGASVESARGGYALRIDRENVDVHRFNRLVAQAGSIAGSGDAERAVALLREAEELWRDDALAGLPGRRIETIRHGLREKRRLATERRVGLELGLGRHAELIGELWELIERYSYAETWISYQMRALHRAGREEDALALYQRDYERRAELGLDPSPGLAELQEQILRRDPLLAATSAARRAIRRASRNGGLPPRPEAIVGRDKELAALCGAADTGTLVVWGIDGMPGSGKTALAIEVAYRLRERYPDPPVFVNFHAHEGGRPPLSARDALCRLLERAGVMPEPAPQATAELTAMWQREAANRRSVIVLDDVPGADALTGVLPAAGESAVIVTSRSRLPGLPASTILTLGDLTLDDAIVLFTRTAGTSKSDDLAVISQAVRLCGCLPLALTLSASRLRDGGSTVSEFVAEIEEQRAFPDRADMAIPGLAETFELSYADLDPGHQEFFRRLGLNPCPDFSPRTSAVLTGTTTEAAESALDVLHGLRLVQQAAVGRFKFHDLLKEYALFVAERDDPDRERRRAMRRLLDYYLNSARRADSLLYPHRADFNAESSATEEPGLISADAARKWFELEWRNIVRLADYAARHEWKQYCADLSDAVAGFLDSRGYWSDGINLLQTTLRCCRELGDAVRLARSAKNLSLFEARTGDYRNALAHVDEAAGIYRATGDRRGVAGSLDRVGTFHRLMGNSRVALAYHQEALEIYQAIQDRHGTADGLCNAGASYSSRGRYSEGIAHYQDALDLYQEIGDWHGEAKCLNNIGDAFRKQGFHGKAMPYFEKAIRLYEKLDSWQHQAIVRLNIGDVAKKKGRYQDAIVAFRAALLTFRESGDLHHIAGALCEIGGAYQVQELYDQALVHYRESEVIAKDIGNLGTQVDASLGIADSLCGSGSYAAALERYRGALVNALQTEDLLQKARALEGMGETRFRMRDLTEARIRLREALDAYRTAGVQEAAARVSLRLATLDAKAS